MRSTYAVVPNKVSHYRSSFARAALPSIDIKALDSAALTSLPRNPATKKPTVIGNIELVDNREPHDVAVSPDGKHAYVTTLFSGTVEVVNTTTGKVVMSVCIGGYPTGLSVTPDGTCLYIGESHGHVYAMNTTTYALTTVVESANYPGKDVALTPDGRYIYVLDNVFNEILVIKTSTNAVVDTIALDQSPQSITIAPNSGFAYIGTDTPATEASGSVIVIDTAIHTIVDTVAVDGGVRFATLSPDENHLYAVTDTCAVVIDTATGVVVATYAGESPAGMAITADGRRAYVANSGSCSVSVVALTEPSTEDPTRGSLGALFGF